VVISKGSFEIKLRIFFINMKIYKVWFSECDEILSYEPADMHFDILLKLFDFLNLLTEFLLLHTLVHNLIKSIQPKDLLFRYGHQKMFYSFVFFLLLQLEYKKFTHYLLTLISYTSK